MKIAILVRHAKSSWDDPSLRDIDRPLNSRGKRDAPFMGKMLRGEGVEPDQLISSPAKRAFTTARYFAKAFDIEEDDIIQKAKIYEAYPEDIINLIRVFDKDWNTVLIFGHNPTFTGVVNRFTDDFISNVPTCGIVKIEADIDTWSEFSPETAKVTAFYYPKQYF